MNLSLISTRKSATQHAINDIAKPQEKIGEVQNYIYQFILSLHLRSIVMSKIFHQLVSIPHIQRLIQLNLTRTDEKRVHNSITMEIQINHSVVDDESINGFLIRGNQRPNTKHTAQFPRRPPLAQGRVQTVRQEYQ